MYTREKLILKSRDSCITAHHFRRHFFGGANPAVPVNDNTQSIFPPDVHAVMDHGKRDVSRFPIATGVYYKKDYSEGRRYFTLQEYSSPDFLHGRKVKV